ncbi:MAG: RNA polymerase sigma-70 factor [Bacteroidales bacterium]|jgi:RNA polymerase sigma-70 factor (ECF subfamily)|nr:RNA polymerase sigma-70 factor [Bacteroidales bacterium]MCI2122262.1 RNA polymerase sigma-70 factor [Bacteroidales bacterium]MCI2145613.1 RNA polymerase sigma-70 factor [Bacteroidales bacterium]
MDEGDISANLVKALRDGDVESFRSFYEFFYPKVHSFAYRLTCSEWAADECAQNVFIKIWTHRNTLKVFGGNLKGLVFRIARNEIFDYYRSIKNIREYQSSLAETVRGEGEADDPVNTAQLAKIIDGVVDSMPVARRRVFILSRYRNMTNDEIAKECNISKRTVEKHISNSLAQIRLALKAYMLLIIVLFFIYG